LTQFYTAVAHHNDAGMVRHVAIRAENPALLQNPSADTNPTQWFITKDTVREIIMHRNEFNIPVSMRLSPADDLVNLAAAIEADRVEVGAQAFNQIAWDVFGHSDLPENIHLNLMVDVYGEGAAAMFGE